MPSEITVTVASPMRREMTYESGGWEDMVTSWRGDTGET